MTNTDYVQRFREFLLETKFRSSWVSPKNLTTVFNEWLSENHSELPSVERDKMIRILDDWGGTKYIESKRWNLDESHVCDRCGNPTEMDAAWNLHRCTVCGHKPRVRDARGPVLVDKETSSLTAFLD